MTLHYFVIWYIKGNLGTRKEEGIDFDVDYRDDNEIDANQRIDAIKEELKERHDIPIDEICLVNICRL